VDKANVLETSKLWREVVTEVAKDYPDITVEHMLVDRAAMELVAKPSQIDVLLTSNLFGDILSDEAAMLAGSLGMLPSASLGGAVGLYEPVHGSAPDIVGKGLANPIGAIASLAMMLRYTFELEDEARAVDRAIESALAKGYITSDLALEGKARSTEEVGDHIAKSVQNA
ncbi:MAG: 3-isopropylmalate dehydrogenase, partial [Acidobacteria bacterium]